VLLLVFLVLVLEKLEKIKKNTKIEREPEIEKILDELKKV
jgi:hypothetical protein